MFLLKSNLFAFEHMHMHVCIYLCVHVCICACVHMFVCMCAYVYIMYLVMLTFSICTERLLF